MEKYQIYHYYRHYKADFTQLYWSYAGLLAIFLTSVAIPAYLQYTAVESVTTDRDVNENYVQWHLEVEIAREKQKTRAKRRKTKRGSVSTEENEV